ncbi:AP-4 complex accessory subunit tepsin isoform X2 [Elephas maximus indicus]|uniref:AP-4 complex accessory subunit tepsin isoform X2 n=1 Tax=Elephas maximus indicus TaxID=99487 RepID=UPI0021165B73|nr:AP-4 complex accessory subunit tepsin isoform X2 [Elephas maximus indicus]
MARLRSFRSFVTCSGCGLTHVGGSSRRASCSFQLPVLLKGTSDDDVPCPGYLFEEIANISHESLGSSQCLLEYLLRRLQSSSGHVKLKVLKILLYLCSHGSSSFLGILKRNSAFIQEATVFTGPPDPLHGNSLYQKVRLAAQDLDSALFSDAVSPLSAPRVPRLLPPTGMGSQPRPHSTLQGFGYSHERGRTGSVGEAFLSTIQKAAEVVANAMRPGHEQPGAQRSTLGDDTYQPAVTPSASHSHPSPGRLLPGASPAVRHQPGQPGGGWEEPDSSPSSRGSSQENGSQSRASDSGSGCVSDGCSRVGREPGELVERVEAVALSDCQQEASLVRAVMQGSRAFLSHEEIQHFLKECGRLNCEAVLELLTRHLAGAQECEQMRALCALSAIGGADLLSQDHVLFLARPRLQELSVGSPGPVTNKATKILRHFEASCRHQPSPRRLPAEPSPTVPVHAQACPPDLLTDASPFPDSQPSLQPLSPSLCLPEGTALPGGLQPSPVPTPATRDTRAGWESSRDAEMGSAGSQEPRVRSDTLDGGPEPNSGPGGCLWAPVANGSNSLFAGMELVACPRLVKARASAREPLLPTSAPEAPRTLAPTVAAQASPTSQLSAFAFLNT